MSTRIEFSYEGTEYVLEFNKKTVRAMEESGFLLSDLKSKPLTVLPTLFQGAFLKNHRFVRTSKIDEIFDKFKNKNELLNKLIEMYSEPISAMFDEPEDPSGNLDWKVSQ